MWEKPNKNSQACDIRFARTMETSARTRALQEPALLYLILTNLSQQELLLVQRVSQTWNRLISTDSRLLSMMWLHPGIPSSTTHVDEATTQVNPLLQKTFRSIFETCEFWDDFTTIPSWNTPFMNMWVSKSPKSLSILKHPTASWRRMIPCLPPPDQLLVNVLGEEKGTIFRLNFSNQNVQNMRPSHPPWLTFGVLYDIVECAWHQANPWRLHCVRFDFPSASLRKRLREEWIPQEAAISNELRASAQTRAGRVRIGLEPDTRSEAERSKAHEEAIADLVRRRKRSKRIGLCGTDWTIRNEVFTDEFHFDDALSLDEIEWDEVDEYDMPPREREPDQPRPRERRFWGIRIGRRR